MEELVIAGGLLKNPFLMQMYADVTRRELSLIESDQGPALGVGHARRGRGGRLPRHRGGHGGDGQGAAGGVHARCRAASEAYDALYAEYATLHDYFGRGANEVMHRLRRIRRRGAAA